MSTKKKLKKVNSYWFSEVPEDWNETKNKYIFNEEKNIVGEKWQEYNLLTMGKTGVKIRNLDDGGKFPESFENYKQVKPKNLIFCLYDIEETPRTVGLSNIFGMITSSYEIISVNSKNNPNFWNYFYTSIDNYKGLKPYYTGLRNVVRMDTFNSIKVYQPSLKEQNNIVSFLDLKLKKIDNLVSKINKKILLLEEKKISLIVEIVSRGLKPKVQLVDTGIDWLEKIPSHWKLKRLKYLFNIVGGKEPKSSRDENGKYPILGTSGVMDYCNNCLYDKKTLLIGRKGTIDKPFLFSEPFWATDVIYYTTQKTNMTPEYLYYLFKTFPFNRYVYGSTQPSMSRLDYESHFFPVPPKEEQQEIQEYLDRKIKIIDDLIMKEKRRVKLLEEYRNSILNEMVTGKKRIES